MVAVLHAPVRTPTHTEASQTTSVSSRLTHKNYTHLELPAQIILRPQINTKSNTKEHLHKKQKMIEHRAVSETARVYLVAGKKKLMGVTLDEQTTNQSGVVTNSMLNDGVTNTRTYPQPKHVTLGVVVLMLCIKMLRVLAILSMAYIIVQIVQHLSVSVSRSIVSGTRMDRKERR